MNSLKFHGDGAKRSSEINGPRPSPLKVNKGSHVIQKAASSSSINKMTIIKHECQKKHPHQPVIIYAHSPKIIHTQPREFMSLVQKLTGLSRSSSYQDDHTERTPPSPIIQKVVVDDDIAGKPSSVASHDDNESCSAVTDEPHVAGGGGCVEDVQVTSCSPINETNQFFADIPLFTPNSANFFCSPQSIYRYSESTDKNMGNSPSVLEFMKGLPEY